MARYYANIEKLKEAIHLLGGNMKFSQTAIIPYQSLMDWQSGRKSPSPENCKKIEKATGGKVTRQEILPDFPWSD